MAERPEAVARTVPAVHGTRPVVPDDDFEVGLGVFLRSEYSGGQLSDLYARFSGGSGPFELRMRRAVMRAMARRVGHGLTIGAGAGFKHAETFEIGDGVFIGEQTFIQGRIDGTCVIGSHVWLGPQSYLDARALIIEDYVGWGPGAKVLGSMHTGMPFDVPIIQTDLEILPVRIGAGADIGVNAVVLPGITVGKGAIVGAGAVVVRDVAPFSIVAGVPAQFIRWRDGHEDAERGG